ncbi:sensor histidine kinase [Stutzerimonas nitrititolerans]|uniref:sensor histidine kinase n=1 Tax=Stutzerimonas nitrititolerans TaxID=2482751 RepID=UPI00289BD219|nr:ATP-binding protein [Stutzerimonas nitrititolerans]
MITREQAIAYLSSDSVDQRLEAARYFSSAAEVTDASLLTRALVKENARWVKRALERAIDRIQVGPPRQDVVLTDVPVIENDSERLVKDLRAQAVDEVSRTILHEFAPLIGSLRLVAGVEVNAYEASRTKHCIERLNGLLEAVGNLKKAASTPSYSEFDLSELVAECVAVLNIASEDIVLRIAGIKPYMVQADRDSLGLAIDNGIRNAVEAVKEFSTLAPAEILINWGPAGSENWLAILDCGAGFSGNPEEAFKLGVSNKDEHFGYGLTTAQLSMRSMEGDVFISNKAEGGARFELRWYRDYANIIR